MGILMGTSKTRVGALDHFHGQILISVAPDSHQRRSLTQGLIDVLGDYR
jgi:hypothetical protein